MARHRSPRGRRASTGSPLRAEPLVRHAAAGPHPSRASLAGPALHRRPVLASTPVRRGAAAVAVTGGALSLMGAAAPQPAPEVAPGIADVAARSPVPAEVTLPDVVMMPAVSPVAPEPDVLDDPTPLVKAVQLGEELAARLEADRAAAEEAARAEAERAAAQAAAEAAEAERRATIAGDCGLNLGQLGAVKDYVRDAADFLGCAHDVDAMHGVAGRAGTSDHPSGKAVDFMIGRTAGDALADCALQNMDALGISYVIWEQRINHGNGWETMEDRGGVTANHFDHVHISFDGPGGGELTGC